MGIIDAYAQRRRKKKLEEINKALERLKKDHPFDPQALKPKVQQSPQQQQQVTKMKSLLWIVTIPLVFLLIVFISLTFYYMGQIGGLEKDYTEQEATLTALQASLGNKTSLLEQKEGELAKRQQLTSNLSQESEQLRDEIQVLEDQIDVLQQDVLTKQAKLLQLNNTVERRDNEINDWMACIEDEFNEDPDECNI